MKSNFSEAIEEKFRKESITLIDSFRTTSPNKRWAFGRNIYSAALSDSDLVAGFIDDYFPNSEWRGRPVIKSVDIEVDAFVIIASGGNTLTIKKKMDLENIKNIDYFAFQKCANYELPEIRFNEGFAEHYDSNTLKFKNTFDLLKDLESKDIYQKLIDFRLTQNIYYLKDFKENQSNQYFDFMHTLGLQPSNFVDIGSYQGENTLTFLKENPDYLDIVIIEPNPENFEIIANRMISLKNVYLFEGVLGSSEGNVQFAGDGTTGLIVDSGGMTVKMKKLDSICEHVSGVTLVKMDVEGGEEEILLGARGTLQRLRPILAISGYHRIQDYWRVPELVFETVDDYSLFIRHYTETIYETVFYFIPNELILESS
jgi:FkbM family methyltransferase